MCILPDDTLTIIESYLSVPTFLTRDNIKRQHRDNTTFYLSFHPTLTDYPHTRADLRTIYELVNMYSCYQEPYEQGYTHPAESPILLDLLFTGCDMPFAQSTSNYFTEVEEAHLAMILRIAPGTVHSTYGTLRCRTDVSPLDAACINERIPDRVIRTLLENGADIHHELTYNGDPVHVLDDLASEQEDNWCMRAEVRAERKIARGRTHRIRKLFVQYGYPDKQKGV
jgi:hypothetical protein